MSAPARCYFLRIDTDNGPLYKIGITNHSVYLRFKAHRKGLNRITILNRWYFKTGINARARENQIKEAYKQYKYRGRNVLINGGNTELFTCDVLGLDAELREK